MNIFTIDVDWAPEEVIEDVLSLLNEHKIAATFFATHDSKVLKRIESEGVHEIALHPNFNKLLTGQGGNYQNVIDELFSLYPSAIGVRSHSLVTSSQILVYCIEKGLKYDSNLFIPYAENPKPFDYFGLLRIPFNWEDDAHWFAGNTFNDCGLKQDAEFNVFNFHPIHIYLNTFNQEMYDQVKHFYQVPEELLKNRNNKILGARDIFLSLLNFSKDLSTCTLKEFYHSNLKKNINA